MSAVSKLPCAPKLVGLGLPTIVESYSVWSSASLATKNNSVLLILVLGVVIISGLVAIGLLATGMETESCLSRDYDKLFN